MVSLNEDDQAEVVKDKGWKLAKVPSKNYESGH